MSVGNAREGRENEQMRLKPIASNMTELSFDDGSAVLFSYETPVACGIAYDGYYRTSQKWSVATSRHINKWLTGIEAIERPQEYFDNLISAELVMPV